MEGFSDERPLKRGEVNIHEILNHCIRLATAGFGSHARFKEEYDPSLPATFGNKDVLIQLFLNLLKMLVKRYLLKGERCESQPPTDME